MINDDYHIACIFYHRYQRSILTRVRPGPSCSAALRPDDATRYKKYNRNRSCDDATQRNRQWGRALGGCAIKSLTSAFTLIRQLHLCYPQA